MKENNSELKFQNLKEFIKNKIHTIIKNEYLQYSRNTKIENLSPKIDQITNDIISNLEKWMQEEIPEKYKEFVFTAIKDEKWSEIIEAFKQEVVFGTSGIRGKIIISLDKKKSENELISLNEYGFESKILRGYNSINEITMTKNILGLINYMNKNNMSKIVIGYDSRISSKLFSRLIASIFLKKGFFVILFDENNSLPELSFAVTHFNADMGIEVTASHNDKRYNGYKLITRSGSPPSAKTRGKISKEIFGNKEKILYELFSINMREEIFELFSKKITIIKKSQLIHSKNEPENYHEQYLKQIENFLFDKNIIKKFSSKISLGYSALHGTGFYSSNKLLGNLGVKNIKYISKMISPEPLFPLFDSKQILDPSDNNTSKVVVNAFIEEHGQEIFDQLDILVYTDPDADRLGIIVNVPDTEKSIYGKWKLLKANDVWLLFLWYILEFLSNSKNKIFNPTDFFIVKNFVTSDSLLDISKKYKIECINGKVGFSDLTEIVKKKWKDRKINIGMFEESCGFGVAGNLDKQFSKSHILEKDAMLSLALIIEILSFTKSQNISLSDILNKIYLDNNGFFTTYRKELPENDVFEGIQMEFYLEQILKNIENFCIKINQRIKDNNPMIIGDFQISKIEKYSTGRYDKKFWTGFPDEGIRFFLGSEINHITVRLSGTEPKLRIFIQYKTDKLNKNNIFEKKLHAENLVKKLSDEIIKMMDLTKLK